MNNIIKIQIAILLLGVTVALVVIMKTNNQQVETVDCEECASGDLVVPQ